MLMISPVNFTASEGTKPKRISDEKKEDMRGTRDARASGELLKKRKWIVRTGGTAFGQNWCEIAPSFVIGMTCSVTHALFPSELESDKIINRGFCEYGIFLY